MDADHQKIGREISDLRDQKARTRDMTLEKIITKPEVVTQFEAEAGAKFKTYLFIACSMREILITGQGIVPSFSSPKRR
jgi:phage pi2 protein 07